MMPLPPFNSNGMLPPLASENGADADRSPYTITMMELVQRFGTTPHRRRLLNNLIAYRGVISAGGYTAGLQFLDGSFVENVEAHSRREPRDIDVFSLLDIPTRYLQDPASWRNGGIQFWAEEIQNTPRNKERFQLDTYATLVQEVPLLDLLKGVMYWYSLFSHQRDTFAWKGFVAVVLDPAQDAEALAWLGAQ
ncbi:hypothetical protein [Shinella sp. HZN7]|uniref:DUF6932 family protein n=1 Tax=Shinella sp. (strain HZN7) TaxID=879274 RepID=UPI001FDA68FC|nr:hypothetical protein [Shinella sp. HZN7]